jgi:hypothetical protein
MSEVQDALRNIPNSLVSMNSDEQPATAQEIPDQVRDDNVMGRITNAQQGHANYRLERREQRLKPV